jgi:peptide chain release factor 1
MREKLDIILAAYDDLTARLADPAVMTDQKEYARLAKEHRAQSPLAEKARRRC